MTPRRCILLWALAGLTLSPDLRESACRGGQPALPDPRTVCLDAARAIHERFQAETFVGRGSLRGLDTWSRRWLEAEYALSKDPADRLSAAQDHLERMRQAKLYVKGKVAAGRSWVGQYLSAENYWAEAEMTLAEAVVGRVRPLEAATTRLATARLCYAECWENGPNGGHALVRGSLHWYWSRRLLDAEWAHATTDDERLAAAQGYLDRSKELEEKFTELFKAGRVTAEYLAEAVYHRADAELLVGRLKSEGRTDALARSEAASERVKSAKTASEESRKHFLLGRGSLTDVYEWSLRWREASLFGASKEERMAATEAHLARMRECRKPIDEWVQAGRAPYWETWAVDYYLAESEILLRQEKAR